MKSILGLVVIAGSVVGLFYLNKATRRDDGRSIIDVAGELPIDVELDQPQQRGIVRTVQAPGEVEAFSEVDISAEVVGKILDMKVEEGDTVKKGDILCNLDDADYQARLRSAEANIAKLKAIILQADADYTKAERDFRRQERLSESNATSALELAEYHTAYIRAKAAVEVRKQELLEAQAMAESVREDIEKTVITAPMDGIVSQRFAKPGEVVIMGTMNNPGTRIMVISDLSKMQVRCRVDETDAPLVKEDQPARIYLQSDVERSIPGHVFRVATKGTKVTGRDVVTFETLVLVESKDPRVKPGMTANVDIEVARSDEAITIPVEAVVNRRRKDLPEDLVAAYDAKALEAPGSHRPRTAEYLNVVFKIEDDVARPLLVDVGISDENGVEVLGGLTPEDRVVIGPFRSLDQLQDGAKVKDLAVEEAKKSGAVDESDSAERTADGDKVEQADGEAGDDRTASTGQARPADEPGGDARPTDAEAPGGDARSTEVEATAKKADTSDDAAGEKLAGNR